MATALAFLAALLALHVWATRRSLREPQAMQDALQRIVDPVQARLLQPLVSRQRYTRENITADPRPNGRPPHHDRYRELVEHDFNGWRFEIGGLVEQPLSLSLDELRRVEPEQQVTLHKCIQGWSYMAEWQGLSLKALLAVAGQLSRPDTSSFARSTTSGKRLATGTTTASSISISRVRRSHCSPTT